MGTDVDVGGDDDNSDGGSDEESSGGRDRDRDDAQAKAAASAYVIRAFGVTSSGRSVSVDVTGFTPFFYVKLGHKVPHNAIAAVLRHLRDLAERCRASLSDAMHFRKRDFWGFTNGAEFDFVRLAFRTSRGARLVAHKLRDPQFVMGMSGSQPVRFQLYETNIDPLLRFFHVRDVRPAGWVRVRGATPCGSNDTTCQARFRARWQGVDPVEREDVAPLVIASFDIECNSSHGDFPVAVKDYRKLAVDVEQAWEHGYGGDPPVKRRPNEYDAKSDLTAYLRSAFFGGVLPHDLSPFPRLHLKREPTTEKQRRSIDDAICRVVDDLYSVLTGRFPQFSGVSRSHDAGGDDDDEDEDGAGGGGGGSGNPTLQELVRRLNRQFNQTWPLRGDEIIQIGTTVNVYGNKECCARFVHVLGSCDPIPGATVRAFDDEADMLLSWVDLIRDLDPDVVLGYNIFGFDFDYLHSRAVELMGERRCELEFCRLGRLNGTPSKLVRQELSSSAMGGNVLKYMDLHGRVLVDLMKVVQREHKLDSYKLDAVAEHFMGLRKHDVSPKDIFRLQRDTSADRRTIAEYCVQDCALCNQLACRLETVANNMGMANVCWVPLSYIFMRGQGVKIFSLVAKQCRDDGMLIPTRRSAALPAGSADAADDGYEGAIVLEPETGMYLDDPVSVLDYNSLYPSSMISENISHDSLVMDPSYANMPDVEYIDISYDLYEGKGDEKRKSGECVCRFAQVAEKAVLPRILQKLLGERKATRRRIEHVRVEIDGETVVGDYDERERTVGGRRIPDGVAVEPAYNAFQRAVLDGLQLAYKVTANSLYGQMGARTSPLYLKHVAACTTAVGRRMILTAKAFIEERCGGRVVYGDTDSIFVVFNNGGLKGRDALVSSIRQGQEASRGIKPLLRPPHNLEYEKTMFPLILLSKKRYVGLLYESDPDVKPKQESMGIALKRRDYAPIVKRIYGGVIDIVLRDRDIPKAVAFLRSSLVDLSNGRFDMAELVISKTLRSYYKLPQQIAHWVLARRMFDRDPGSAPQVNDRVPYVFVETTKTDALMGDRIEHVDYVRATGMRVDTKTYIENQIRKPCLQLLSCCLEQLPGYVSKTEVSGPDALKRLVDAKSGNVQKARDRLDALREREVDRLIFAPVLALPVFRMRDNRCARQREIDSIFKPLKK